MGIQTPWGFSDGQHKQAEGMIWYDTPSHGGLKITPELVEKIPAYLMPPKNYAWYEDICWNGWFEEDCEWARVGLAFPEAFTAKEVKAAEDTVSWTWPDLWEEYKQRRGSK